MAGITPSGLTIRTLPEVIDELKSKAITIFQDLVPADDTVDVGEETILGRMIGVVSPSAADIWEAIQQLYSAFDPNAATGLALDNLISLSGIVRFSESASICKVLLQGAYDTIIAANSVVASSFTGKRFDIPASITLDEDKASSATFTITTVTNSTVYTISFTDGLISRTCSYTSDASATVSEILTGLKAAIDSLASSIVTATIISSTAIKVDLINLYSPVTFSKTANISFSKIGKISDVICQDMGPYEQALNTIDSISTPILGWDSVINIAAATVGRYRETDEELRLRFYNAKYTRGSNILDALQSDLVNIQGVEKVIIFENITEATDVNGLLPHTFMAIVQGGLDQEIADVLWLNKPAGIGTHGNTAVDVLDSLGQTKVVNFQRPTQTRIYVSLTVTDTGGFPSDGPEQIKKALVDYFRNNQSIGDDVIYSRLYTPVNSVKGHQVDSLTIGIAASPVGTSNISIAVSNVASLDIADIDITAA